MKFDIISSRLIMTHKEDNKVVNYLELLLKDGHNYFGYCLVDMSYKPEQIRWALEAGEEVFDEMISFRELPYEYTKTIKPTEYVLYFGDEEEARDDYYDLVYKVIDYLIKIG